MKLTLITVLAFSFIAWNNLLDKKSAENKKSKVSLANIENNSNLHLLKKNYSTLEEVPNSYQNADSWTEFSLGFCGKTTFLYDSNRFNANIIDTLPFLSIVKILSEGQDFFLVWTRKGERGYIKKTQLYLNQVAGNYYLGLNKYGTNDISSCAESELKVVKLHWRNNKEIVDKYYDTILGKSYDVKYINSALYNSNAVLHLNYSCYKEASVIKNHFIIDNGQKLSRLIKTSNFGEGGYSRKNTVYLPIKLRNRKKIVLAKNGTLSIDKTTANPEIYSYPSNLGVPKDELIVVEKKSVNKRLSKEEKRENKYNKKVTILSTTFYQWNGTKIEKIKTIKQN